MWTREAQKYTCGCPPGTARANIGTSRPCGVHIVDADAPMFARATTVSSGTHVNAGKHQFIWRTQRNPHPVVANIHVHPCLPAWQCQGTHGPIPDQDASRCTAPRSPSIAARTPESWVRFHPGLPGIHRVVGKANTGWRRMDGFSLLGQESRGNIPGDVREHLAEQKRGDR
jgi:hypothetical protein